VEDVTREHVPATCPGVEPDGSRIDCLCVTLEGGAAGKRCMFRERFLAEKPLVLIAR